MISKPPTITPSDDFKDKPQSPFVVDKSTIREIMTNHTEQVSVGYRAVPASIAADDHTTGGILRAMAATFEERNKVYGSNYKMVAPMMAVLFPDGVPSELVTQHHWHLFELVLVKLSRFAISGLSHQDSVHDMGVYCAMIESIVLENSKEAK